MNVGRLKNKVRNQAVAITKLLECAKADKKLISTVHETNKLLSGECGDLKIRCEETEEMLRQAEAHLEAKDKDIKKYQETIEALQIGKQDAEEQTNTYFQALLKSREEKRELESRLDYWKEAYTKISFELEEAKKPWFKKLLKC